MRNRTLMQITSIREEDNMKTMKKAISVLLLVCMVSALCSAGAYAVDPATPADTGGGSGAASSFNIALDKQIFSTNEQVSAKATFPDNIKSDEYTITWTFGGTKPFTASKGSTTVAWQAGEIKNGQEISATATNDTDTLTSNTVTAKVIPPVSSAIISNNNGTLSFTAKAADGTDVTSNIKAFAWTSDNIKVTLASPAAATTTYSSTDTSVAQTAKITVTVTDNFDTVVISTPSSVTIPAAPVSVTGVTVTPATANVAPGGQVQMSAKVLPENAAQNVTWSVTGSATIDQKGLVTANGTAANGDKITVTATAQADNTKTGTATLTVIARPTITVNITKNNDGSYTANASSSDGNPYTYNWNWDSNPNDGIVLHYSDGNKTVTVTNTNPNDATISLTATASVTINGALVSGSDTLEITVPGTPRKIAAKLSPNNDPLTVGDTTNTKQLIAYFADDQSQTPIADGISWKQTAQNPASGNIATLNGNVVTAGNTPGTVTYEAYLNGTATGAKVTVTVQAADSNVNLKINQLNKPANVDWFTITAKGGVITLQAVATDSKTGVALPGTYSWRPGNLRIGDGIGVTGNANDTATVSGKYNGSGNDAYPVIVTFTPSDTINYKVTTATCAVNVKFPHVIDSGNGQGWDGRNGMYFATNDSYYNFNYDVRVDGQPIALGNGYTYHSTPDGRILIHLTPECIKYIKTYYNGNGTHTISIGNTNAAPATGSFRTWGTYSSFYGVKTGDDANLGLWAALLAVSAAGAGAAVVIYKRRKKNNG